MTSGQFKAYAVEQGLGVGVRDRSDIIMANANSLNNWTLANQNGYVLNSEVRLLLDMIVLGLVHFVSIDDISLADLVLTGKISVDDANVLRLIRDNSQQ